MRYEIAQTAQDIQKAFDLRIKVFVEEQNVPIEMEIDDDDATAVHIVARDEQDKVVGTGRLVVHENTGKIGRMAVDESQRGQGVGREIILKLEEIAREKGLSDIHLHAQVEAKRFYEKLGYIERGDIFDDAGIPHIDMFKVL